jgi:hypothetical protein
VYFILAALLLWRLFRSKPSFRNFSTQRLTLLLGGMLLASDPFYIGLFFTASSSLRVFDSLLHLFFTTIGMLFLPFLELRQLTLISGLWKVVLHGLPFLIAFCVIGILTARELLNFNENFFVKPSSAMHIVRFVILGLYFAVVAPLSWMYREDAPGQKIVVVTLVFAFPVAQLIAEIGETVDSAIAGIVPLFELTVAVEHVMFFAVHNWPRMSMRDFVDDHLDPDSHDDGPGEQTAALAEGLVVERSERL